MKIFYFQVVLMRISFGVYCKAQATQEKRVNKSNNSLRAYRGNEIFMRVWWYEGHGGGGGGRRRTSLGELF